jgi:hypothetical protein
MDPPDTSIRLAGIKSGMERNRTECDMWFIAMGDLPSYPLARSKRPIVKEKTKV